MVGISADLQQLLKAASFIPGGADVELEVGSVPDGGHDACFAVRLHDKRSRRVIQVCVLPREPDDAEVAAASARAGLLVLATLMGRRAALRTLDAERARDP